MAFELFVNGTLMRGMKLHMNLCDSRFIADIRTAPSYRLHSIGDVHPGMYRLDEGEPGGASIWGELYMVGEGVWHTIKEGEPPNLYRGMVELEDGREVYGILYPRDLAQQYLDISEFGGWRAYCAAQAQA
jgi:AGZA family xanthine/uracil permease-like MFS transporter